MYGCVALDRESVAKTPCKRRYCTDICSLIENLKSMKPILFPEGQKDFSTNGLGRLPDAISCKVTEERNGQYVTTNKGVLQAPDGRQDHPRRQSGPAVDGR